MKRVLFCRRPAAGLSLLTRALPTLWVASLGLLLLCGEAGALPGFFATKTATTPTSTSTQIAVMMNGDDTVVTLMTNYQGPMKPFALVLAVPSDVKLDDVKVLKRRALERLEEITAPRFHEFWEMDPCAPGETEQIWERKLEARAESDFLGGGEMVKGTNKVPKVMRERLDTDYRNEGHAFSLELVPSDVKSWLKKEGLQVPDGVDLASYQDMSFLVARVDPKRVELGPHGEALLSPLRYSTRQQSELPTTLGNAHVSKAHELLLYVLHPEKRYKVGNYKNIFPPTNLQVDYEVKERMGDFYAALYDQLTAKTPGAFVTEYAWEVETCGEPCPDAPLKMFEILTLGADVFEQSVPEEQKNPDPPERSEEEQAKYDALEDREQKERDDEVRTEVARREALFKRHKNYVMTRLHYRYNAEGMPKDIELLPAAPVRGGVDIPKGAGGELPQGESKADENKFQTRFLHLHPNKKVLKCDEPKRYRWGKPPRTYRGARKIWVADQLANRNRTRIQPKEVVLTKVPSLGLQGQSEPTEKQDQTAETKAEPKASDCGCRLPGQSSGRGGWLLSGLLVVSLLRRRRTRLR